MTWGSVLHTPWSVFCVIEDRASAPNDVSSVPLIYSFSEIQFFNPNYKIIVPILFISISILLISKIPTYSLKKIVVPRSTTIFLLLVVVLYFGLLLIYTFNTLIVSGALYLLMIPVSAVHYLKINKNNKIKDDNIDHHEDVL